MISAEAILQVVPYIAAVVTALTALKLIVGAIVPMARKMGAGVKSAIATVKRVGSVMDTVEKMSKYIGPNGGSSLMDKVNDLGDQIKELHESLNRRVGELQTLYRVSMDLRHELWWETDSMGSMVWVSRRYLELLHSRMADMAGNGWVSTIHSDDRDDVFAEWKRCVADSRDFRMKYRILDAGGVVLNVRSFASPIRSESEIVGWLGSTEVA
jgi:PAS domain S-box-containing protein